MAKTTKTATASRSAATGRKAAQAPSRSTAAAGKTATAKAATEETKLRELFVDELKDIYWAEKHLAKALPKLAKAATSQELADAFRLHLEETENQVQRLEEVFGLLEMAARAKKCEAMEGLVREAVSCIEDTDQGTATRDAALIIAAQKAEHYEIASYGSLVQLAKTMGMEAIARLLQETLDEEKKTDTILTELAVSSININADNEPEEE
ncbi:ferritin-like domain-containing protein [Paraflavisolibacter sp. H34]|uniref:ferritin-like domain-containing protein n=1 Tax=Huijunlia imazamoxiresistens TaxID=3127457 RepID=UPI00301711D6